MGYTGAAYIVCFLLLTMVLYQLAPKKYRWVVFLLMSILHFASYEVRNIGIVLLVTGLAWFDGLIMGIIKQLQAKKPTDGLSREEKKKKKARDLLVQKVVVTLGVLSVLGTLFMSKYYTFVADNINLLMYLKGKPMPMPGIQVMTAVGLSYFVLQSVAYMVDVYWDKVDVQRNPGKILMYLIFFPTLVQGPIALMRDMQGTLFAGESLKLENIERGYIRIIWGAFKKIVVADRISVAVNSLYDVGTPRTGMYIAAAAIFFTIQEYMDFSGCVDIAIGSAEIFGIVLPENFRQPFVSRNASEFWRRWHITLGTFFKTYIFYPVSLSKLTKKWNKFGKKKLNPYGTRLGAMAIALLPVWLCNGIWHGPKWTYIFYGIYYFIIIMIELALEPMWAKVRKLMHLDDDAKVVVFLQIAKTWIVIFVGEMLFRADTLAEGFAMLGRLFVDFRLSSIWDGGFLEIGIGAGDYKAIVLGIILVTIVGAMKERGIDVRTKIMNAKLPVRWAVVLGFMVLVIILGQYGPGYRKIDFIYAGF